MINTKTKILIAFLIILCGCESPKIEERPTSICSGHLGKQIKQEFEPYLESLLSDFGFDCSMAVGVTANDQVVYAKAFGHAHKEKQTPVDIHTVYHLASVSKPFVATALVKLAEEGKVDLEDRIVDHLPYFKVKGSDYDRITIKQMLTHTSGLPDVEGYDWDNPSFDEQALERFTKSVAHREMIFEPGDDYAYSNLAYNCLGDLIEKVSGRPFATYVQEELLEPIGMNESSFLMPDTMPNNWAYPHVTVLDTDVWPYYPYNRMHGPSSTLHANIVDMCKWGIWNVNRGQDASNVISSESYDQLVTPHYNLPWDEEIGLSWYLGDFDGHRTIRHTGADDGFRSRFLVFPDLGYSISIMTNQSDAPIGYVLKALMFLLTDKELETYKVPGRIPFGKTLAKHGIEKAKESWAQIKADSTSIYSADEDQLNDLGYALLGTDQTELAFHVLEFNSTQFPQSANVHDSLGDAYLALGDTLNAIDSYENALMVDPEFGASISNLDRLKSFSR